MKTLKQQADEQGISRQALWLKTEKGKAYKKTDKYKALRRKLHKAYYKTDKYKAYQKAYQKAYYLKHKNPVACQE